MLKPWIVVASIIGIALSSTIAPAAANAAELSGEFRFKLTQQIVENHWGSESLDGFASQLLVNEPDSRAMLDRLGSHIDPQAYLSESDSQKSQAMVVRAAQSLGEDLEREYTELSPRMDEAGLDTVLNRRLQQLHEYRFFLPRSKAAIEKSWQGSIAGKIKNTVDAVATKKWPNDQRIRDASSDEQSEAFKGVSGGELRGNFNARRAALSRLLPSSPILISGGRQIVRNNDVNVAFRQGSDFLFLTGLEEPDHQLLIDPRDGRQILFTPRPAPRGIVFNGPGMTPNEVKRVYGVDEAHYSDELPGMLPKLLSGAKEMHVAANSGGMVDGISKAMGVTLLRDPLRQALNSLRWIKTETEIKLMRIAGDISSAAHAAAMRETRPGQQEYEVQAAVEKAIREGGLNHLAYPSIVASGAHSAILHYEQNGYPVMGSSNRPIKSGDLVLIDAAGEFMQSSDISRTFPAEERFSGPQRDIYSIVLDAQKAAINMARPGLLISDLRNAAARIIADGLKSLRILKGSTDDLLTSETVRIFFPHGLSHWMGNDVHDVGDYKSKLQPGNVISAEPGIYFNPMVLSDPLVREKYKDHINFNGIEKWFDFGGVRIEDDIVIQKDGPPLNLTTAPKEIADIEELRRHAFH